MSAKNTAILIPIFITLATFPIHSQIITLCTPGSTPVMGGEYNVMNNVWGSGPGVGDQCLDVDLDGTYFKVCQCTHDDADVSAYPAIFKGCHWGWCTTANNPMPVMINRIESAPITWVVHTEGVSGTWNTAFEAWFNANGVGTNYLGELMIWIDYHGGAGPAGSVQETVNIGGYNWDVYYADWDWNYVTYKITSPVDSVTLEFRDFIHDCASRGYLMTNWYMVSMEAGFEIWRDGEGLTSEFYSADVIEGIDTTNFKPSPFLLRNPRNRRTIDSLQITFEWYESVDPNLDPVEYLLHIYGPGLDTTVAEITDLLFEFDGRDHLLPGETYEWDVYATDKRDTTKCSISRSFKTPATSVSERLFPDLFSLSQNYPNPFNAEMTIPFTIQTGSHTELVIFNMTGETQLCVIDDYLQPGSYAIRVDGDEWPSGLYYYELRTAGQIRRKKCLLIK
jgi:hypothetical protein